MTCHQYTGKPMPALRKAMRGLAVVVVLASALWSAAPADAAPEPTTYYLSLGDSLAQGYQPIGGPHSNSAAVGYEQGYANQLFKQARDGGGEHLRLVKLGCGGETTASMIGARTASARMTMTPARNWVTRSSSSTSTLARSRSSRSTSGSTTSSNARATRAASSRRSRRTCRSSWTRSATMRGPACRSSA